MARRLRLLPNVAASTEETGAGPSVGPESIPPPCRIGLPKVRSSLDDPFDLAWDDFDAADAEEAAASGAAASGLLSCAFSEPPPEPPADGDSDVGALTGNAALQTSPRGSRGLVSSAARHYLEEEELEHPSLAADLAEDSDEYSDDEQPELDKPTAGG